MIANLHADEPSQVRSASPAVGALQQVTRTVPGISGKRLSGSKRLRRVSRESRSFGMPLRPPGSASSLPSNPRHRRLGSS